MTEPATITVSFSEINSWRVCPMRHYLSYRRRQQSRFGVAAYRGTLWHSIMARFREGLVEGRDREELYDEVLNAAFSAPAFEQEDVDRMGILEWMWEGFKELDTFADYTPLACEYEHIYELPRIPEQPEWLTIRMKVKIDLIARNKATGRLIVGDYKTTSELRKSLGPDMDVDDQIGIYLAGLRDMMRQGIFVGPGIEGARWAYSVTSKLKPTKKEPDKERPIEDRHWAIDSTRTTRELNMIEREASLTVLDAYRRRIDVEPPRAPDKDKCRWRCDHRDACFFARQTGRPVHVTVGYKPDQLPYGTER